MPRREILTAAERLELLAFPEGELDEGRMAHRDAGYIDDGIQCSGVTVEWNSKIAGPRSGFRGDGLQD